MTLNLKSLEKALVSLEETLKRANDNELMSKLDDVTQRAVQAGAIQNFEFTYELCWKFMKRWLDHNLGAAYVDGISRRELFRISAEHQLIENIEKWFVYHEARNRTSHTYENNIADEVFNLTNSFQKDARIFFDSLKHKND